MSKRFRNIVTVLIVCCGIFVGHIETVAVASVDMAETNYWETYVVEPDPSDQRNALKWETYKWPNGTVPYLFDETYTEQNRAAVLSGMDIFRKETCVRFVPKTSQHTEHIKFTKSSACGANVGYRKNRKESLDVTYSEYCLTIRGAIQHEMFHVLGLLHEQARPDRDDHIQIFWENIDSSKCHFTSRNHVFVSGNFSHTLTHTGYYSNFGKAGYDVVDTFGLPYDYNSLMHYPGNAFAKSNKNVTIISKVHSSYPSIDL